MDCPMETGCEAGLGISSAEDTEEEDVAMDVGMDGAGDNPIVRRARLHA